MTKENPYSVVRVETTMEYDGAVKVTHIAGFNSKGSLVKDVTYRDYPDGSRGHSSYIVESDGYWNGGAYDPQTGIGCSFAPKKFEEKP